ncbi:MAG: exonuclease subunit SbcD [Treponema sp.]|jgi:exonuclease SbcD|nr:exonuclease subunit SbcD [Treponema sp.]
MIKFLHTADLHLGKTFYDLSLIEDQGYVLDQIAALLLDPSYRALVIAGDVYDRSVPSPEAVRLFGAFLAGLKAQNPRLEIFVIPGNHDSSVRLGFGRELFGELGIHFAADPEDSFEPVILEDAGGGCAFFLLPFLNPGSLIGGGEGSGEPGILRSQAQLAAEAARRLELSRRRWAARGLSHAVLAAHLFAGGGIESESERIFLGGAEKVDMGLFAAFDYVALGHLHRRQRAGRNGWYAGSPLAYSFDEGGLEKAVLSVEIPNGGDPRVEPIPLKALHPVRRLSGPFERFNRPSPQDGELQEAGEDYLEFNLRDSSLTENALPLLQLRYPRLLSVRQEEARRGLQNAYALPAASGERRDAAADFAEFLTSLYGQSDEGKVKLFRELLAQVEAKDREAPAYSPEESVYSPEEPGESGGSSKGSKEYEESEGGAR